jgi:preprotein translocase subunit SecG
MTLLTVIHVLIALFLIVVVLLQAGRGGGVGATFGGASTQIFGGRGAGNFLTKLTTVFAIGFFVTSLTLSVMSTKEQSVVPRQTEGTAAAEGDETDKDTSAEGKTAGQAVGSDEAAGAEDGKGDAANGDEAEVAGEPAAADAAAQADDSADATAEPSAAPAAQQAPDSAPEGTKPTEEAKPAAE